jgi:hypothetical protein
MLGKETYFIMLVTKRIRTEMILRGHMLRQYRNYTASATLLSLLQSISCGKINMEISRQESWDRYAD